MIFHAKKTDVGSHRGEPTVNSLKKATAATAVALSLLSCNDTSQNNRYAGDSCPENAAKSSLSFTGDLDGYVHRGSSFSGGRLEDQAVSGLANAQVSLHPWGPQLALNEIAVSLSEYLDAQVDVTVDGLFLEKIALDGKEITTSEDIKFRFLLNSVPLCGLGGVGKQIDLDRYLILGRRPPLGTVVRNIVHDLSFERALSLFIASSGLSADPPVVSAERCWAPFSGGLTPAWMMVVELVDGSFGLTIDETGLREFESIGFGVTGRILSYNANPVDGQLGVKAVDNMDCSGYLTNDRFELQALSGELAFADNFSFFYDPDDPKFWQASVFANANEMAKWLADRGAFPDGEKLNLVIDPNPDNRRANDAFYKPASASNTRIPSINLGVGDGFVFRNLQTDKDVVFHELVHHFIFQYVTSNVGESLLIHEGVADFLTIMATGDSCIANSVCVEGSPCVLPRQCLRTSENNFNFADEYLKLDAHARSQVVSGMLWDLQVVPGFSSDQVTPVVLAAIKMLPETATLRDLVLALMAADTKLFAGSHACIILQIAKARGFEQLADVSCVNTVP